MTKITARTLLMLEALAALTVASCGDSKIISRDQTVAGPVPTVRAVVPSLPVLTPQCGPALGGVPVCWVTLTAAQEAEFIAAGKNLATVPWVAYLMPPSAILADPGEIELPEPAIQGEYNWLKSGTLCRQNVPIGLSKGKANTYFWTCYQAVQQASVFAATAQEYLPLINFALMIGNYDAAWDIAEAHGLAYVLETPMGFHMMGIPKFVGAAGLAQMKAFYAAAALPKHWNFSYLGTNPYPPTQWGDPSKAASDAIVNFETANDNDYPDVARFMAQQPPVSWEQKWLPVIADIAVTVVTYGAASTIATAIDDTFLVTSQVGVALVQQGVSLGLQEIETYFKGGSPVEVFEDNVLDFALFGNVPGVSAIDPSALTTRLSTSFENNLLNGVLNSTVTSTVNQLVNTGKINWTSVGEGFFIAAASNAAIQSVYPSSTGNGGGSFNATVPASTDGPLPVTAPTALSVDIDPTTQGLWGVTVSGVSAVTITTAADPNGIAALANILAVSEPFIPGTSDTDTPPPDGLDEITVTAMHYQDELTLLALYKDPEWEDPPNLATLEEKIAQGAVFDSPTVPKNLLEAQAQGVGALEVATDALSLNVIGGGTGKAVLALSELTTLSTDISNLSEIDFKSDAAGVQTVHGMVTAALNEASTALGMSYDGATAAGFTQLVLMSMGIAPSAVNAIGYDVDKGWSSDATWQNCQGFDPKITWNGPNLTVIIPLCTQSRPCGT